MGVSLDKVQRQAPGLLDLAKKAQVSLGKTRLGSAHTAKVGVALDFSGSMRNEYRSGGMQELTERVLALGTQFDDDGAIDLFLFDTDADYVGEVGLDNYRGAVDRLTSGRRMGNFIAYKGVDGNYLSHRAGLGIVQGRRFENAHLDNSPGNTLEVPRSYVESDNNVACAQGLHVGSLSYAQMWAKGGKVLAVSVNPRDVVSVPRDHDFQKCRVNRYTVVQEAPSALPTVRVWDRGQDWDIEGSVDDYCEWCARNGEDCTCEHCDECSEVRDECICDRCCYCGELSHECECDEDEDEDEGDNQLPPGATAIFI